MNAGLWRATSRPDYKNDINRKRGYILRLKLERSDNYNTLKHWHLVGPHRAIARKQQSRRIGFRRLTPQSEHVKGIWKCIFKVSATMYYTEFAGRGKGTYSPRESFKEVVENVLLHYFHVPWYCTVYQVCTTGEIFINFNPSIFGFQPMLWNYWEFSAIMESLSKVKLHSIIRLLLS